MTLGGAIGIPCNGSRLLARLGVYEPLLARGAIISDIVMHSSHGVDLGTVDITKWSENKTGYPYLRVKRKCLVEQLLEEAEKEPGIEIHWGKKLVEILEGTNSVSVRFQDDSIDAADMLLGCDGIHSVVRSTYVDPVTKPEYSGLSSMFSLVANKQNIPGITPIQSLHATLTADGLFAVTPSETAKNELYWFFTEEVPIPEGDNARDGWEEKGKHAMASFKTKLVDGVLKDVGGDWGTFLKALVSSSDTVKFYPVFRLPLGRNWHKGRCLLLGDAGHAMQPHAGQGVSMALEDVFLLSRLLQSSSTFAKPKSTTEIFTRFEQLRKPRVEKFYKTAASSGQNRKRMPPWKLALFEQACLHGLWVFNLLGLNKMGMSGSQGDLVYDIESVPLWN